MKGSLRLEAVVRAGVVTCAVSGVYTGFLPNVLK